MNLNDYWTSRDAARMYDKLRAINPHLPEPEYVRPQFAIRAGAEEMTTITLDVVIKLPVDEPKLADEPYQYTGVCDVCGEAMQRKRLPREGEGVYCRRKECQRVRIRVNKRAQRAREESDD